MQLIQARIDYAATVPARHCVLFTANAVVKTNGELVMGAGNAKACKLAHPQAPLKFGNLTKAKPHQRVYIIPCGLGAVGSFQTKLDWKAPTPIDILKESIEVLHALATKYSSWVFHLPVPAIGHGGLSRDVVFPMLQHLPDNVLVYH